MRASEPLAVSQLPPVTQEASGRRKTVLAAASVVAALTVLLIPMEVSALAHRALAITVGMILFWIFEPVDHAITGLAGCFLYWATNCAKFEAAFSGFSHDTPWFLFGAIVMGAMAYQTGLAKRLAFTIMSAIGSSYSRILLGIIVVDFLLTLIVPSGMARVVILASICLGVVDSFGVPPKSNISRGLFIIITYTATIFDKMVIAGVTSILARGLIQDVGGIPVYYGQWFLAYLPCDLITVIACWGTIRWLYPPEREQLAAGSATYLQDQLAKLGKFSRAEMRASILIGVAVALWLTDFVHHISASMIGLGVGLLACFPRIGVLNSDDLRKVNLLPIILVGAVSSMADVLIATRAVDLLNALFFSWLEPLIPTINRSTVVLYWLGFAYHFFFPEPSMISTSMPLLMQFARTHHLSPLALGMIWTFAAGGKIFVYQSPVLVVGYSYGHFEGKDLFRVGLVLTAVESLILMLIVPIYWPLIGIK